MTNPNDTDQWQLPGAAGTTFVFIGGGDEVCVAHRGGSRDVPFTRYTTVTTARLKIALRDVPKQAEGERMMFCAAWCLLRLAHELEHRPRCASFQFVFDSYDTDALVGHLLPFVLAVQLQARQFAADSTWGGRAMLRMHPKSPQVSARHH
jgi:hypothetical protein